MFRIYCILIGYLIGCIQFAFIIAKINSKIDIREHGSGNAGTTNVIRILGAKAGIMVFILDILKGVFAFIIASKIFDGGGTFLGEKTILPGIYAGFGAILGHDFPFYLKFKGGKGTATTIGFTLFINPIVATLTYILGFGTIFITKYVSLGSLVMSFVCLISMIFLKLETEAIIIMAIVLIVSYYKHFDNIKRLLTKKENKLSFKKH